MDNIQISKQHYRTISEDCRNLVITSLSKYSDVPPINYNNGKTKIRTGLVSKFSNGPNLFFIQSSEFSGISLRSYNSTQAKDLNLKQRIFNPQRDLNTSLDAKKYSSGDFLIVKQSKIALYEVYNIIILT